VFNAAVIVDPSNNQIISSAYDGTSTWDAPPSHGSIRSSSCQKVAGFASRPLANGSYSPLKRHSNIASIDPQSATVSCVNPWGWCHEQHSSRSYWHPLRHAAMVAIEDSATRDMQLFPDMKSANEYVWSSALQVSAPSPPKKQKTDCAEVIVEENGTRKYTNSKADRPYLCTGYDMYLAWESCIMCAMAIVHQRVRRVFYAFPNITAGALGSVQRLQGEKSLNHHYAVFRVVLALA
ncbi:tRNA-specific adenosine deaminase TAD3-like protein, partial [Drosera capensis]